jgi:hypothetical protein
LAQPDTAASRAEELAQLDAVLARTLLQPLHLREDFA